VRNKVSPAFALDYDADPGGNWTILKLLAGNVTIRGVRFELNARGAEIQMTGIDWQGGTLLVDNCSFSQEGYANTQRERVASISISGRSERVGEPAVNLQSCYFAGGEDALFLTGPGGVHASQCAFAPHANALFELGKKFNQADPHRTVMLANCS